MVTKTDPRPSPAPPRPRTGAPGRPKDPGKRAAILAAAKRLFMTHGYEGASMDQIAADAKVSKLTVYSHFGDKDSLFTAAITAKLEEQVPSALFQTAEGGADADTGGLRVQLNRIGQAFFALVSSEESLSMHRMMMTGTGEPHVRHLFWEAGPRRLKAGFAEFLRESIGRGQLRIEDPERAAGQFFCLLKGDLHVRLMCGLCEPPTPAEIAAHVEACIDMFMRAYGTEG